MKAEIRELLSKKAETLKGGRVVIVPDFSQLDDLVNDLDDLFALRGVGRTLCEHPFDKVVRNNNNINYCSKCDKAI